MAGALALRWHEMVQPAKTSPRLESGQANVKTRADRHSKTAQKEDLILELLAFLNLFRFGFNPSHQPSHDLYYNYEGSCILSKDSCALAQPLSASNCGCGLAALGSSVVETLGTNLTAPILLLTAKLTATTIRRPPSSLVPDGLTAKTPGGYPLSLSRFSVRGS
jgi:hypothetical protein